MAAKILLFSDPHFSINSEKGEEKWFPPVCDFFDKINHSGRLTAKFLRFWDNVTQKAFKKVIKKALNNGPYDLVIGLGDYTPGTNESGMITEKAREQYVLFESSLGRIGAKKLLVWGDHDAGYKFDVSGRMGIKIGTEEGGISPESVEAATRLIGPPFGCFFVSGVKFVFISTNLVRNVDKKSPKELQMLKLEQENFLAKTLCGSKKNVFLLLHDPTALGKNTAVRKIIDSNREKIEAIFHGHFHAEFSRFFAKLSPVCRDLCKNYETILVPATWGFMGIGGGFITMDIYGGRVCTIENHKL